MSMQVRPPLDPVIFDTAAAILNWQPSSVNPLMVSSVPISPRKALDPNTPQRFLVGLDNGQWSYWDEFDRYPQGGRRGNVYNFQFWQYVDDIYYYMHALAAVPPVVWTNAAHRNGVRMFAAVTADFDNGNGGEEFNKLFEDPEKAANQLFAIVNTYRFDGWMFDVEGSAVTSDNLLAAMTSLRKKILWSGAQVEVGFYHGTVCAITDDLVPFFNAGSFYQSDYALRFDTTDYPKMSYACLVKNKIADKRLNTYWSAYPNNFSTQQRLPGEALYNGCVYLDVDKFFDCLGLALAKPPDHGYYQSFGIYAPDWTMYGGIFEHGCPLPQRSLFQQTERLFWQGTANGPDRRPITISQSVSEFIPPRTTLVAPPFLTRFNTGQGSFFAMSGKRVVSGEWNYMSGQDLLPTQIVQSGTPDLNVIADYTYDHAFDGGSALAINGTIPPTETIEYPLFIAKMPVSSAHQAVFRYKAGAGSILPYVKIVYGDKTTAVVKAAGGAGWQRVVQPLSPPAGAEITEIRVGFANSAIGPSAVDIVLGELGIISTANVQPPSPIGLVPPQDGLLTWQAPPGFTLWYYNVFVVTASGPAFVGRTLLTSYDLTVPLFPIVGVPQKYLIQPVTTEGHATPVLPV